MAKVPLILSLLITIFSPKFLCTDKSPEINIRRSFQWIPLGTVRVTQYTHIECHGRLTSSGYVLKNEDENRVCAIGRDWWRKKIHPGDLVWVDGYAEPCVALDTMALKNRKGLPQTRWIDIYVTDPVKGLNFGIRHAKAYHLSRRRK